jgi:hypothetical protein
MKAQLEDIPSKIGDASFYAKHLRVPAFEFKWHYHPEYELTYIVKGNGYRIVGNSHEPFAAGDLVLLGSNLPHTWHSKAEDSSPSEAIVIQFSKAFITPFLALNEAKPLIALFAAANKGLHFEADPALVLALMKMVDRKPEMLKLVTIKTDSGQDLSVEGFLTQIQNLKVII